MKTDNKVILALQTRKLNKILIELDVPQISLEDASQFELDIFQHDFTIENIGISIAHDWKEANEIPFDDKDEILREHYDLQYN
jgi:hypothetical protein